MSRRVVLDCLLFLLLLLPLCSDPCLAQLPPLEGLTEQVEPAFELPDFAGRMVPGEAVVDLADFISGYLADSGALPDFVQVQTADGLPRRIPTAEAFVLLARTVHLWQTMGDLPQTVPLAPDEVRAPLLDPEDIPESELDLSTGREIPTDQFLEQCDDTVRWVDRLHTIPTAVWVAGERLSAAEYLAGLAICLQYAYWEGGLYDTIYVRRYHPPQSWIWRYLEQAGETLPGPTESEEEQLWEELPLEQVGWEEGGEEQALLPVLPSETPEPYSAPAPAPQLTLFPRSGSTLSGKVDLVASYLGPPPRFVVFEIDGAMRAIVNLPPYSFRWDTSALQPGPHTVRVQVLGEEETILTDQLCGFTVVLPEPKRPEQTFVDDL